MEGKFQNKYRNESIRLQRWDYAWNAAYFITICTKDREDYFGKIVDGSMQLSPVGAIANVLWYEIKNHAKNVELGEFVVMPNHIHGIIVLDGNNRHGKTDAHHNDGDGSCPHDVGARHALPLRQQQKRPQQPHQPVDHPQPLDSDQIPKKTIGQQRFQNQGKNTISSIVGSYKSAMTKHGNRLNLKFAWQPLFYDHIIRDQKSFQRISEYIKKNPTKWSEDQFHNKN